MTRQTVRLAVLCVLASVLGSGLLSAQVSSTREARTATEAWLALVDSQQYAASWDGAASFFRARVTSAQWQAAAEAARAPFGQLKARTLKSATSTTSLPGAPDGQYVVFQFIATFEQKASALETVTAILESDGAWRVTGYFIK